MSAAVVGAQPGGVDSDTLNLQQHLTSLDGVRADFQQQISDARGLQLEQSSGHIYLAKPNFRWEVSDPFPQIIIARGDELQIYDPDLEQLTVRSLQEESSLQETPLTLLTRQDLQLAEEFEVRAAQTPDRTHFYLIPRAADALFASLELTFSDGLLVSLIIIDHTGQQSVIRFENFSRDADIPAGVFELELPPDVDIVRG